LGLGLRWEDENEDEEEEEAWYFRRFFAGPCGWKAIFVFSRVL
jgi:hypothetical protein